MTEPVTSYTVTLTDKTTVTVAAQSFSDHQGLIVFYSSSNQTVAAFAAGSWVQVNPAVTP